MIKSYYIEGTNKKAFVIENTNGDKVMFTYARPAVYTVNGKDPVRIWDGFRVNSGKHILKFNNTLTKKTWESMEVKPAPCTGKFIIDGKTNAVEAVFGNKRFLIINGETLLCKDTNNIYRLTDKKFYKRYTQYINKFLNKEITDTDWNSFAIKEDLSF